MDLLFTLFTKVNVSPQKTLRTLKGLHDSLEYFVTFGSQRKSAPQNPGLAL